MKGLIRSVSQWTFKSVEDLGHALITLLTRVSFRHEHRMDLFPAPFVH